MAEEKKAKDPKKPEKKGKVSFAPTEIPSEENKPARKARGKKQLEDMTKKREARRVK